MDQPGQDVASGLVRTGQMVSRGPGQARREVEGLGVVRGEDRSQEGDQDEREHDRDGRREQWSLAEDPEAAQTGAAAQHAGCGGLPFEAQGARRPALVLPDSPTRFYAGVLAAYGDWCAEHGRPEHVVFAPEAGNGPVVEAVEVALSGTCRPDALCVVPEASPPLVLEAARRHGYDVPGDLLVVCVSEDATATHTRPALSTLSLRPQEVAEAGIDLLVAALGQGGAPSAGVLVQTRLEVRASSLRTDTGAGTD
ncbi:substrate-binding domain-containing protein [Streptomyces sp. CEV 2-1]|uniref:substrate-binding domain-containing protein n=1 Tax=Streptomyces sp. CEV 2-1 TaxID=2485153 RepID=UPI0021A6387C|nr:substrate-binding domain-containing protein [Streptomyces sp. CEV 2-1]